MPHIDRQEFIGHLWDYFLVILLSPENPRHLAIALAIGLLVLAIGLAKLHAWGNAASGSLLAGLVAAVIGVFALLTIAAWTQMLVLPRVPQKHFHPLIFAGALLAAHLLMVVPFTRALFRAGYGTSVGSWLLSLLLSAMALFGLKTYLSGDPGRQKIPTLEEVKEYGKSVIDPAGKPAH